jgi:polyferredoxin
MGNLNSAQKARRRKQIISSLVFIAVIELGRRYPFTGLISVPMIMFGCAGISLFNGRKWCDWLCIRGSFFDVFIKPISRQKEIPEIFKNMTFRVLIILLSFSYIGVNIFYAAGDYNKMGLVLVNFLIITTLAGMILGIIIHQRVWCYICPFGSTAHILANHKKLIRINAKKCNDCLECKKDCPIQINPAAYKSMGILKDSDCLKCKICLPACAKNALQY